MEYEGKVPFLTCTQTHPHTRSYRTLRVTKINIFLASYVARKCKMGLITICTHNGHRTNLLSCIYHYGHRESSLAFNDNRKNKTKQTQTEELQLTTLKEEASLLTRSRPH